MSNITSMTFGLVLSLLPQLPSADDRSLENTAESFLASSGAAGVPCPEGMTRDRMRMAHVSCCALKTGLDEFKVAVMNEVKSRGWRVGKEWQASEYPATDGGSPIPTQMMTAWTDAHLLVLQVITPPASPPKECVIFWVSSADVSPQQGSSHDQAVIELLRLLDVERMTEAGMTTMLDVQLKSNPALGPYREVLLHWAAKVFTWDAIAPEFIKLYEEAFTEPEIREIVAFYRTPTGQKALAKLPELFQKGASIGVTLAQAHQAELVEMVEARKKQLDAEATKP